MRSKNQRKGHCTYPTSPTPASSYSSYSSSTNYTAYTSSYRSWRITPQRNKSRLTAWSQNSPLQRTQRTRTSLCSSRTSSKFKICAASSLRWRRGCRLWRAWRRSWRGRWGRKLRKKSKRSNRITRPSSPSSPKFSLNSTLNSSISPPSSRPQPTNSKLWNSQSNPKIKSWKCSSKNSKIKQKIIWNRWKRKLREAI